MQSNGQMSHNAMACFRKGYLERIMRHVAISLFGKSSVGSKSASDVGLMDDGLETKNLHPLKGRRSLKLRRRLTRGLDGEGSDEDAELMAELTRKAGEINEQLTQLRLDARNESFSNVVLTASKDGVLKSDWQSSSNALNFKVRRTLRGHLSKVLRIKWIGKSNDLLSISPDGRVLYWDTKSGMKKMLKQLPSLWSTCCACSSDGRLLATGGLDNLCTIRSIKNFKQFLSLSGHTAFISQCAFLSNDERILTCSGDNTIILWDVTTTQPIHVFKGHFSDVLDMSLSEDEKCLLTVSVDRTCRVWDVPQRRCCRICTGHEGDVNSAAFFPNGQAFVTGSDDQSCRMFDIRSDQYVAIYNREGQRMEDKAAGVTSVALSKSGRLIIAGCEDSKCLIWDTLEPSRGVLSTLAHPNRVSGVCVNFDGDAIATGCWDCNIRIWN